MARNASGAAYAGHSGIRWNNELGWAPIATLVASWLSQANFNKNQSESQAHPVFRSHLEGRVAFMESVNPAKAKRLRVLFVRDPVADANPIQLPHEAADGNLPDFSGCDGSGWVWRDPQMG